MKKNTSLSIKYMMSLCLVSASFSLLSGCSTTKIDPATKPQKYKKAKPRNTKNPILFMIKHLESDDDVVVEKYSLVDGKNLTPVEERQTTEVTDPKKTQGQTEQHTQQDAEQQKTQEKTEPETKKNTELQWAQWRTEAETKKHTGLQQVQWRNEAETKKYTEQQETQGKTEQQTEESAEQQETQGKTEQQTEESIELQQALWLTEQEAQKKSVKQKISNLEDFFEGDAVANHSNNDTLNSMTEENIRTVNKEEGLSSWQDIFNTFEKTTDDGLIE